jgi:ABC-type phosphate transport system substrate-binding protein
VTTRRGARIRAFRRLFWVLVALCALSAGLIQPAGAARHRTASVSPGTNLTDEVVKVSWAGFRPTDNNNGLYGVTIMQCRANPKSVDKDCNTDETFPYSLDGNQQPGTTAQDGTGSAFIDIMTSARLPSLACSESNPCSLMLFETTANGFNPAGLPPARVIVPLQFARSQTDCPPVRQFDFRMETESSAAPALYDWATHFCTGAHAFNVDVTNSSSNAARADFFNNEVDIAVTSVKPKASEMEGHPRPFAVAPLDLNAVVLAYNITDSKTNKQITDLTLSPRLVARLISDSQVSTMFNDPEFLKLNPGHSWPITMAEPGLRGEENADTWILTNWVEGSKNARALLTGHDKYGVRVNPAWKNVKYPTDLFDARDPNGVYLPRTGEEGVAQRLFAQTNPADSVPTATLDAGQIGVLDLPTAERFKLPIAKLTNGPNSPAVAVTPASLAAGFADMQKSSAGFYSMPATVSAPGVYPLTKVDVAMVPPKLTNSPQDLRIRAFLDYAVTDGQSTLPPGYAAFPTALATQTLQYTGDLNLLPPPTTTTTTLPSTTVADGSAGSNDFSGGSTGYSGGSSSGNVPPATAGTTPTTKSSNHVVKVTKTVEPKHVKFVAISLPDTGDRFALPVVFGLALLALLGWGVDIAYRRVHRRARR